MTTGNETTSIAIAGKTALIVGATSSLAHAIAHVLASQGCGLVLAARDEEETDILASDIVLRHNVPCMTMVSDFLDTHFSPESLIRQAGEFDFLIIATGIMGGNDPTNLANIAYTSHINYMLPAQIATVAANHLANKNGGSIVLISSVAGDRGRQSNYAYGSAKAALSTFASGLRNYYYNQNVHVMTVKPGFIDTPLTWGMKSPLIASRDYAAWKIIEAMRDKKNVVYVPFFWRYIMMVIKTIPEGIFMRLKL